MIPELVVRYDVGAPLNGVPTAEQASPKTTHHIHSVITSRSCVEVVDMVDTFGTENTNDVNRTGMAEPNSFSSTFFEAALRIVNTQGCVACVCTTVVIVCGLESHLSFCPSSTAARVPHEQMKYTLQSNVPVV